MKFSSVMLIALGLLLQLSAMGQERSWTTYRQRSWQRDGVSNRGSNKNNATSGVSVSNCKYVRDAQPESDDGPETGVYGYFVPGCETQICTGSIECDVSVEGQSGKTKTFTGEFAHVMCTAKGKSCPTATQCARMGGILEDVAAKVTDSDKFDGQRFMPTEKTIEHR